jgi:hypothetical protein
MENLSYSLEWILQRPRVQGTEIVHSSPGYYILAVHFVVIGITNPESLSKERLMSSQTHIFEDIFTQMK